MRIVFLGLGSNLGDKKAQLTAAVNMFGDSVFLCSSVYESLPYGNTDQPSFLNMVCGIRTEETLREVFRFIKNIEKDLGRLQREKWGPREIDIDILLGDKEDILNDEDLVVPHTDMLNRAFVLMPLFEIAADFIHPVSRLSIRTHWRMFKQSHSEPLPVYSGAVFRKINLPSAGRVS